ncbi:hypothetical protein D3C72_1275450 [compost metagenome]
MADGDLVTQRQRRARIGMEHGAFLDVGVLAHHDRFVVATDHHAGPGTRARLERHVADDGGFGGHVGIAVDGRGEVADLVKRHGVSCVLPEAVGLVRQSGVIGDGRRD